MTTYSKMLAMVLVTILSAAVAALADNHVSQAEGINILLAGLGALAVFAAPNVPGAPVTKLVLAALVAAATAAASFIGAGTIASITPSEWIQVAIAVFGALGVWAVPNVPTPALAAGLGPAAR